jgi:hypothetical protein
MGGCILSVIWLGFVVLIAAAMWKVFEKAGKPGWACLVPIYNCYVLCRIAGKPGWWLVLLLIPLVNLVIVILIYHEISKAFGYGAGMTLMMFFLPFVAYPVLGFGEASYSAPEGAHD